MNKEQRDQIRNWKRIQWSSS